MDSYFRDRTAKVLVVDSSGASRTLLTEVVRNLGFTDVHGVPSLKDALGVMEVEPVRWLISSLFTEQPENLLQTLKLLCSHRELKQLRVSALVEEEEMEILPHAFEKGLLSYHRKPFTKDSINSELKDLFSRYENFGWQSTALSGSYLRQCLAQLNAYTELLAFERQLFKTFPGDFQQMLNLVLPLVKTEKVDEAKLILKQVQTIAPQLEGQVKNLCSLHLGGASLEGSQGSLNLLNLKTVMIIDSDTNVQNEIRSALGELGVESFHIFDDGEAALAHLRSNPNPDLIIQEWRIPRLTGPLFLQKAQEEGAKSTPFILLSSLIQKEDIPFVREMGVAHVLPKPAPRKALIEGIIWTIQQDRRPTEQGSMERKMRQLLAERKVEEAMEIKARYGTDPHITIGAKEIIEAEFAFCLGDFEKARDYGIEAIKHAGESIFILNLLGKALISMRDFETALRCFQKAQALAPLNLERLCQIAEIQSELGNNDKANEILEEVKSMDPNSQRAEESAAKVAINSGDSQTAKKIMGQLRALENVVSYMNNQAIAMARCNLFDEGIEQYRKTLEAVPEERPDIKSIVEYNRALAYLRNSKLVEAKDCLGRASAYAQSKVYQKAQALLRKVEVAIQKGVNLQIAKGPIMPGGEAVKADESQEADPAKNGPSDEVKLKVLSAVENKPGEIACFMIYSTTLENPKVKKMLEGSIRFNPRKAIERQESLGADRALAAR